MPVRKLNPMLAILAGIFICTYQPSASAQKQTTRTGLENIVTNAARHFGDAPEFHLTERPTEDPHGNKSE
jgi:hypothetical protein